MLNRNIAATIRRRLEGSPLNGNREEVEVIEEGGKTTFPHDRTWEFLRYFFQCLEEAVNTSSQVIQGGTYAQSLFGEIDI